MDIIIGKTSGFCEGVSYTVKKAYELAKDDSRKIYCLGEIVHNEKVVGDLAKLGIVFVNSIDDVQNDSKMIIRAHGETKEVYEIASRKNIEIVDLTCGKIRIIRKKIEQHNEDCLIIIVGKKNHPETIGTLSFCNDGVVLEFEDDFENLRSLVENCNKKQIYIVAQTTFNEEKFYALCEKVKAEFNNCKVEVDNTICDATHKRQEETKEIAKNVDAMIIIGGKNSSNTKELFNVAKEFCEKTILIQDKNDLESYLEVLDGASKIGIMAGASTPEAVVKDVIATFGDVHF